MSAIAISDLQSERREQYPEPIQKRATCCALGAKVGALVLALGFVCLMGETPVPGAGLFGLFITMAGVPRAYKKCNELAARYFK